MVSRDADYRCLDAYGQFYRTIQEVALASHSVVLCGRLMLSWSQLVRACFALDKSKIYERIELLAWSAKENKSQQKQSLYQTRAPLNFYPPHAVTSVAHVRAGLGIQDAYLKYAPRLEVTGLTGMMAMFRSSLTTEPRDRAYGLLGLTKYTSITPDYGKSVQAVYCDAIFHHLEKMRDLSFLEAVQDSSRTALKDLPSWVPDYSVEAYPQRFNHGSAAATQFQAAKAFPFCYSILKEPTPSLKLPGYVLVSIDDVADCDLNYDLQGLLRLLCGLPHLYKADITHRADEITEGFSGKFELKVEDGFLIGIETKTGSSVA